MTVTTALTSIVLIVSLLRTIISVDWADVSTSLDMTEEGLDMTGEELDMTEDEPDTVEGESEIAGVKDCFARLHCHRPMKAVIK